MVLDLINFGLDLILDEIVCVVIKTQHPYLKLGDKKKLFSLILIIIIRFKLTLIQLLWFGFKITTILRIFFKVYNLKHNILYLIEIS